MNTFIYIDNIACEITLVLSFYAVYEFEHYLRFQILMCSIQFKLLREVLAFKVYIQFLGLKFEY